MENSKKSTNKSCIVFGILIGGGLLIFALAAGYYFLVYSPSNAQPDEFAISGGPDVMFISPSSGTMAEVGDSLLAHVTANDVAGVSRIDLWIDGTLALSQPSPQEAGVSPLSLYHSLNALLPGDYSLVARAYNTRGAMSESIAINVKVIEAQEGDADDDSLQYVVQEGDTLEKIAEKTGSKVDDIKANNPGLGNLKPNQIIAIKHPPVKKGAVNPNMGAIAGLQPQALPAGLQILAGGQVNQQLPSIDPDFNKLKDQNPSPVKIPDGLAAKVDGCKVTLSWNDRSDNETGFSIFRRNLGRVASPSQKVGHIGIDKNSFVDEVPYPETYEYAVEALILDQDAQGNVKVFDAGRSQPLQVKVEPSAKCIKNPQSFKYVYMKIDDVYPKSSDIGHIAVWFSINDGTPHRLPGRRKSIDYALVGQWNNMEEIKIPIPTSVFLNPDQHIIVKIWASGYTEAAWKDKSEGPLELGVTALSHRVNEFLSIPKKIDVNGPEFKAKYQIWVEDVKWDAVMGDSTCSGMDAPLNLHIDPSVPNTRRLVWDYNKILPHDFILYRSYSCVGQESRIEAPIFISREKRSYDIDYRYEPLGCVYRYEIASVSDCGQSKRSNAVEGDTEAGLRVLWVTFKELRINNIYGGNQAGQILLRAGYHNRKTNPFWLGQGVFIMENFFLNGKKPNNQAYMVLADKQTPEILYMVSGVDKKGNAIGGSICAGTFLYLPPLDTWGNKTERTETLVSNDGNCEMDIDLKLDPAIPSSSGSKVLPQADLVVDDIATIGGRFYARIKNNGPDQLPGNQTYLFTGHTLHCPMVGADSNVYGSYLSMTPWVGFNTPVWVYLGDEYSRTLARMIPNFKESMDENPTSKCTLTLRVHISNKDEDGTGELFYIDPNLSNQIYTHPALYILPMQ